MIRQGKDHGDFFIRIFSSPDKVASLLWSLNGVLGTEKESFFISVHIK